MALKVCSQDQKRHMAQNLCCLPSNPPPTLPAHVQGWGAHAWLPSSATPDTWGCLGILCLLTLCSLANKICTIYMDVQYLCKYSNTESACWEEWPLWQLPVIVRGSQCVWGRPGARPGRPTELSVFLLLLLYFFLVLPALPQDYHVNNLGSTFPMFSSCLYKYIQKYKRMCITDIIFTIKYTSQWFNSPRPPW